MQALSGTVALSATTTSIGLWTALGPQWNFRTTYKVNTSNLAIKELYLNWFNLPCVGVIFWVRTLCSQRFGRNCASICRVTSMFKMETAAYSEWLVATYEIREDRIQQKATISILKIHICLHLSKYGFMTQRGLISQHNILSIKFCKLSLI
jgi:hypothetical protein